jgi:uncharacterized protein YjbI with pentapeptide repeats
MDSNRFDALVRALHQPRSRRGALGALLGGVLVHFAPAAEGKPGKGRGRGKNHRGAGKGKGRDEVRAAQVPATCCSTGNCTPGKGKNLSKCCYEGADVSGKNFSGANLGSANFTEADASRANFAGANLGKACLVDTILTGAKVNSSTNLGGAIFCRTTMPDGSTNDSGCDRGTRCCNTCIAEGQTCGAGIGGACCAGTACIAGQCVEQEPCDVCPSGCPFTTLGPAVDATDDGGTIRICPGTYRTLDVIIFKDVTIVGAGDGAGGTILDGERQARVLDIDDATVTIRDLTVTRGGVTGFDLGGGIFVGSVSTLTLERVQVTDNANGLLGGGIIVDTTSTLHLRQSAVTNNRVDIEGQGGGIYNQGTVTLNASRIAGNVVPDGPGGGIFNTEGAMVALTNGSQVTENMAERGGGVFNQGQLTVSGGSTITGNTGGNCEDIGTGSGCPA